MLFFETFHNFVLSTSFTLTRIRKLADAFIFKYEQISYVQRNAKSSNLSIKQLQLEEKVTHNKVS